MPINVDVLISAVCDIGSASFKYDMRRLSEILAFPKAWYRRSIARRLFLGDQTINLPGEFVISQALQNLWMVFTPLYSFVFLCWVCAKMRTVIVPSSLWNFSVYMTGTVNSEHLIFPQSFLSAVDFRMKVLLVLTLPSNKKLILSFSICRIPQADLWLFKQVCLGLSANLCGLSLCSFLISHPADLHSANIFPPLLRVDIFKAVPNVHLSTFTLLQPLAPPPQTQPKTSPSICPPSPAAKPTGGRGMAARGHSTCLSPPTSFQSTRLEATCPLADLATSNPLHLFALGACLIPPLLGEVITLAVSKWNI